MRYRFPSRLSCKSRAEQVTLCPDVVEDLLHRCMFSRVLLSSELLQFIPGRHANLNCGLPRSEHRHTNVENPRMKVILGNLAPHVPENTTSEDVERSIFANSPIMSMTRSLGPSGDNPVIILGFQNGSTVYKFLELEFGLGFHQHGLPIKRMMTSLLYKGCSVLPSK